MRVISHHPQVGRFLAFTVADRKSAGHPLEYPNVLEYSQVLDVALLSHMQNIPCMSFDFHNTTQSHTAQTA